MLDAWHITGWNGRLNSIHSGIFRSNPIPLLPELARNLNVTTTEIFSALASGGVFEHMSMKAIRNSGEPDRHTLWSAWWMCGVAVGMAMVVFGYIRFSGIEDRYSTEPSGVIWFGLGGYLAMILVLGQLWHLRYRRRLVGIPKGAMLLGLPAWLALSLAVEYTFIPFPEGGANGGFYDRTQEYVIDQDGEVIWTILAIALALGTTAAAGMWLINGERSVRRFPVRGMW